MAATNLIEKLTAIGDAIRGKTGESGTLTLDAMAATIEALETGGGFNSNHVDIAYGSFIPAVEDLGVIVECGFPISESDAFMCVFGSIPIATRTTSCNLAGYIANNMPSAALGTEYGGSFYASKTATQASSNTSVNLYNWFVGTTGTNIRLQGYGAWNFTTAHEYFWVVVKEKRA